jgi:predicted dehydrogenase
MAEYHAKKFSALPGVSVGACSDRHLDRARGFAERLGIPRWFASTSEMAKSGEIDCIATAVVDSGHARAALDALERGLPVFAEKPLARTLPEAEAMLAGARAAAVPAVVNFSKRNAPPVALARRLVSEGRLGRIRGASFTYLQSWLLNEEWGRWDVTPRWRWRVAAATSTHGVIGDLGSHLIDSLRFIVGDIQSVSCSVTAFTADPAQPGGEGSPDSFAAIFRMHAGGLASARASWRAAGHVDTFAFTIEGDQGSLSADLGELRDSLRHFDSGSGAWSVVKAPRVPSTYEQFIDEVRGGGGGAPGFADGLEVQRVIEACAASAREGRAVPVGGQE